jgi:hypothetical protein
MISDTFCEEISMALSCAPVPYRQSLVRYCPGGNRVYSFHDCGLKEIKHTFS